MRGSKLLKASLKVLTDSPVGFLGHEGCGYEGCAHSCVNFLQEQLFELSKWVPCSNKAWAHEERLEDGCNDHPEVSSETLVLALCKSLCKDLQGKLRKVYNEGKSVAYQTLSGLVIQGKHVLTQC